MKYRKKPVVIEALQLTLENLEKFQEFMGDKYRKHTHLGELETVRMTIETLEGTMLATEWDWIIRGVKGEFYPCKPDIFEATYERVE